MIHLWQMARATKAKKVQHLNAAHRLLQRQLPRADAVRQLSREFDFSKRQSPIASPETSQLGRPGEFWSHRNRRVECVSAYSRNFCAEDAFRSIGQFKGVGNISVWQGHQAICPGNWVPLTVR